MRIGVMGAMPEEISLIKADMQIIQTHHYGGRIYYEGLLHDQMIILVLCRVGKVGAASTVTTLINQFAVDSVIFTGVAGSGDPDVKIGDIVIADKLIQHDMDASPLFPRYEIPLLGVQYFETHAVYRDTLRAAVQHFLAVENQKNKSLSAWGIINPSVHIGTIASGDQFVKDHRILREMQDNIPNLKCVEMEGAAVAQVCYEYHVPFLIIRTISDEADEAAPGNFSDFIRDIAGPYARDLLTGLFKHPSYWG